MQHGEAVPAIANPTDRVNGLCKHRKHRFSVRASERTLTDQPDLLRELRFLVLHEIGKRIRSRAKIGVVIGEVRFLADHADLEVARTPALADARIDDRCFFARVRTDDHQAVGLIDAGNRRVEEIARAAILRMQHGAVLTAIDVR